jgi:hypothetical protein
VVGTADHDGEGPGELDPGHGHQVEAVVGPQANIGDQDLRGRSFFEHPPGIGEARTGTGRETGSTKGSDPVGKHVGVGADDEDICGHVSAALDSAKGTPQLIGLKRP